MSRPPKVKSNPARLNLSCEHAGGAVPAWEFYVALCLEHTGALALSSLSDVYLWSKNHVIAQDKNQVQQLLWANASQFATSGLGTREGIRTLSALRC